MACTTILVGKKASYDGSTMIARNDDSGSGHFTPKKFVVIHPEDQKRMSLAAEAYVRAMLERDFRTLDFYKSLRGAIPTAESVKDENQQ